VAKILEGYFINGGASSSNDHKHTLNELILCQQNILKFLESIPNTQSRSQKEHWKLNAHVDAVGHGEEVVSWERRK